MAGVRGVAALGRLVAGGPADADAVLLARFAEAGDEAAFATLVKRHGPLVAAVCRRHLRQPADVDDAVQATFLVLARKAGAVHTAVGPWLYRVAERTASRLRRSVRPTEALPEVPARPGGLPPDVRAVVADELGRLPEQYRMAVELCYVAGFGTAEAAARLGWPKGTVLTRLAWARRRLRANLTRRGVTLGGSLAAVLADRAASGVGPPAVRLGGEAAGRVLSLCDGVIRAMTLTKLGWAAGLTAAAVAVTGTAVGPWAGAQDRPADPPPPSLPSPRPLLPDPKVPDPMPAKPPLTLPPSDRPPSVELTPPPQFVPTPEPLDRLPEPVRAPEPARPTGRTYTVSHPAGSFVREFADGERFAVRFDADRLYVEATFGDKAKPATLSLDADYAMNKEGVVFGVVTGAEYDGPQLPEAKYWTGLVGEPFAIRVRADDGAVTVKDIRVGEVRSQPGHGPDDLNRLLSGIMGRYVSTKEPVAATQKAGKPKLPRLGRGEPVVPTAVPAAPPPLPGKPTT